MWRYNSTDELVHGYKYIKKIKTGSGTRYFYTQAEIDAYNQERRGLTNNDKINNYSSNPQAFSGDGKGRNVRYSSDKSKRLHSRKKVVTGSASITNGLKENDDKYRRKTQMAAAKKEIAKSINEAKKDAGKTINKGRKKAEKLFNKAKRDVKSEVSGAKRAVDIWRQPKNKKGDKVAIYSGKDKYYDEVKVAKVKKDKKGNQITSLDWKKKKRKKNNPS